MDKQMANFIRIASLPLFEESKPVIPTAEVNIKPVVKDQIVEEIESIKFKINSRRIEDKSNDYIAGHEDLLEYTNILLDNFLNNYLEAE